MLATDPGKTARARALRRLSFMLVALLGFDLFVPSTLARLERRHYEGGAAFRFENSDLFALGPVVAYLREHPHSTRRRAVFLGNSMTFGYGLAAEKALPAAFEKRRPEMRAFNLAINGQELGTGYLIAKAIAGSVDVFFVQVIGDLANPMLGALIPVDDHDFARFRLPRPNRLEQQLKSVAGRTWRLYGTTERIQAALFGTSTRQYLYLHKRDIVLSMLRRRATPARNDESAFAATAAHPTLRIPRADAASLAAGPTSISGLLRDFAERARVHKKRALFIEYEYDKPLDDSGVAQFNASYAPFAEVVMIHVPRALTNDGQHLNAQGARLVAELLDRHEREAEAPR